MTMANERGKTEEKERRHPRYINFTEKAGYSLLVFIRAILLYKFNGIAVCFVTWHIRETIRWLRYDPITTAAGIRTRRVNITLFAVFPFNVDQPCLHRDTCFAGQIFFANQHIEGFDFCSSSSVEINSDLKTETPGVIFPTFSYWHWPQLVEPPPPLTSVRSSQ